MGKILFSFVFFLMAFCASAQKVTDLSAVGSHLGDSVLTEGKVYGIRSFPDASNAPTLINIGAAFPNQLLTVVIYGEDLKNFTKPPAEVFKDANVRINGKVELYKNRPQIVVKDQAGLSVLTGTNSN